MTVRSKLAIFKADYAAAESDQKQKRGSGQFVDLGRINVPFGDTVGVANNGHETVPSFTTFQFDSRKKRPDFGVSIFLSRSRIYDDDNDAAGLPNVPSN
ncbi:unnamed protein product [Dovyalis caffra]|uniref:Uncharacterized protein n=1 Tax=Dovyalis caffra TaxID=77055 RepID=A0AAV1QW66_9ROSI|nr:unnamed protein product [Dovyalis caffra]